MKAGFDGGQFLLLSAATRVIKIPTCGSGLQAGRVLTGGYVLMARFSNCSSIGWNCGREPSHRPAGDPRRLSQAIPLGNADDNRTRGRRA
jgi:hypothetical protein